VLDVEVGYPTSRTDIVWPEKKESPFDYKAWKPSFDGEEPPF
jgi:hypothetical protein